MSSPDSSCSSLWCDYLHTQFDPAHLLSELGFTIIFDFLLLWVIWGKLLRPYLNKRVEQAHRELDKEHGVVHSDLEKEGDQQE